MVAVFLNNILINTSKKIMQRERFYVSKRWIDKDQGLKLDSRMLFGQKFVINVTKLPFIWGENIWKTKIVYFLGNWKN